jgi:REP element-mobilizing transposase RayT
LKNKECHLYRINGVEDHVHILTSLHPTLALSDLIHGDLRLDQIRKNMAGGLPHGGRGIVTDRI